MRNICQADKWRLSVLAILGLLAGCGDKIVKAESFPELAYVETGEVSCHHSGYCQTCGLDFHGKLSCGFRLRPNCPGEQLAIVKRIPARRTYESGRVENYTIDTVTQVKGACE